MIFASKHTVDRKRAKWLGRPVVWKRA